MKRLPVIVIDAHTDRELDHIIARMSDEQKTAFAKRNRLSDWWNLSVLDMDSAIKTAMQTGAR